MQFAGLRVSALAAIREQWLIGMNSKLRLQSKMRNW